MEEEKIGEVFKGGMADLRIKREEEEVAEECEGEYS